MGMQQSCSFRPMRAHRVRSTTVQPPADDAGVPDLVELLRAEIAADGPITFARFMERALYEPSLGYYATSTDRPTPAGDFVTAPELHPVFGWTVARQVDEMWRQMDRPQDFVICEYGAGSGALVVSLLEGLVVLGSPLAQALTYDPIDLPAQGAFLEARLDAAGHGERLLKAPDVARRGSITGVVLANEFLDALPVHRVVVNDGELREIYVDWEKDGFLAVAGEPSTDELKQWFLDSGITLEEGQQAEVNLALLAWVDVVASELDRGFVLVIDYGAEPADLYGPTRITGTLRAFAGQHVSGDVLRGVGRRDITAHVDFGALERGARTAGLDVLGRRRLNEFLVAAGLDDAYAAARADADAEWESAVMLRAAVRRLLDSAALGGYQVAALAKAVPGAAALTGLQPLPSAGRRATYREG
jgi:SAM-dependent MidA family methyltransferase